ncbi:MAG: hypothetical protein IJ009_00360 [Clostridia bacterium]|nr:hypothetical protein [Clostridia bacterium]
MKKRILSLFLAVVMIVLAIPAVILPTLGATLDVSYKTGFSDAEIVAENANKENYPTGTVFEFPKGWEIGSMSPSAWGEDYYVTNISRNSGEYFNGALNNWMDGAGGGGFYLSNGQLIASITYIDETADLNGDGSTSANDRTFSALRSNILVRYTAEFSGTVSIDVPDLEFVNTWNALFCILVNGEPVDQFAEGFDYATGAGWFTPTAVDSTSAINAISNLSVKAGDTIDFVFRGTGVDSTSVADFNYSNCKRLAQNWEFAVTYSSLEMTSDAVVSTDFNLFSNFPVEDYKNAYNDGYASTVQPSKDNKFDYTGKAWQLGSLNMSYDESKVTSSASVDDYLTLGTSFAPYTFVGSSSSATQYFIVNDNNGMNGASTTGKSGSIYVQSIGSGASLDYKISMAPGALYAGYNDNNGGQITVEGIGKYYDRKVTAYTASATIRYVAQYSGAATVTIDGSWISDANKGYAYLWVLHNGERIASIKHDGNNVDLSVDVNLKGGDTLDFVCVADPVYSALALDSTNENFYRSDITSFNLEANRRTFRVNNIGVSFTSDVFGVTPSVWNGANSVTLSSTANQSTTLPFFRWYDANDTAITADAAALDTTCYAVVNPDMLTWLGIDETEAETMTLSDLWTAYWAKFMEENKLNYASDRWQMVSIDRNGNTQGIYYTFWWHNSPITSVALAGGTTDYGFDGQYLVSAQSMTNVIADLWNKLLANVATTDSVAADTTVANVRMQYADALKNAYNINCYSNGTYSAATSIHYIRPTSGTNSFTNPPYGGYEYTVAHTGFLNITLDDIVNRNAGTFTWNIAHNGAYVFDAAQTADITTDTGKQALKDAIAAVDLYVEKGDKVVLCFARNSSGSATFLSPTITVMETYVPDVEASSSVKLVITDSYAVKLEVTPGTANGAVDVLVDDAVVATLNATNGYAYMLKSGIKVSELTATTSSTATWVTDTDGVTVSYKLREEVNGHVVTGELRSTNTDKMLAYYEASDDAELATLATEIRHLAIVTEAVLNRGSATGDMTYDEKMHLRNADTALAALLENKPAYGYAGNEGSFSYVIAGANVNYGDKISVVLVIDGLSGADIWALKDGSYKLSAYNKDGELVTSATEFAGVTLDKEYIGVIVDVPISMYDQTMTFVVEGANGAVSDALNYSVQAWMANKYTNTASWTDYVIRGVYNLGVAAAAYTNANA